MGFDVSFCRFAVCLLYFFGRELICSLTQSLGVVLSCPVCDFCIYSLFMAHNSGADVCVFTGPPLVRGCSCLGLLTPCVHLCVLWLVLLGLWGLWLWQTSTHNAANPPWSSWPNLLFCLFSLVVRTIGNTNMRLVLSPSRVTTPKHVPPHPSAPTIDHYNHTLTSRIPSPAHAMLLWICRVFVRGA